MSDNADQGTPPSSSLLGVAMVRAQTYLRGNGRVIGLLSEAVKQFCVGLERRNGLLFGKKIAAGFPTAILDILYWR